MTRDKHAVPPELTSRWDRQRVKLESVTSVWMGAGRGGGGGGAAGAPPARRRGRGVAGDLRPGPLPELRSRASARCSSRDRIVRE